MNIKGIEELLEANGLDPNQSIKIDGRVTNIFTHVEAHLMGAFDDVEQGVEDMDE